MVAPTRAVTLALAIFCEWYLINTTTNLYNFRNIKRIWSQWYSEASSCYCHSHLGTLFSPSLAAGESVGDLNSALSYLDSTPCGASCGTQTISFTADAGAGGSYDTIEVITLADANADPSTGVVVATYTSGGSGDASAISSGATFTVDETNARSISATLELDLPVDFGLGGLYWLGKLTVGTDLAYSDNPLSLDKYREFRIIMHRIICQKHPKKLYCTLQTVQYIPQKTALGKRLTRDLFVTVGHEYLTFWCKNIMYKLKLTKYLYWWTPFWSI